MHADETADKKHQQVQRKYYTPQLLFLAFPTQVVRDQLKRTGAAAISQETRPTSLDGSSVKFKMDLNGKEVSGEPISDAYQLNHITEKRRGRFRGLAVFIKVCMIYSLFIRYMLPGSLYDFAVQRRNTSSRHSRTVSQSYAAQILRTLSQHQ